VKAGHEIGHHGFLHKMPDREKLDETFEEIDLGFEALEKVLGVRPIGYRAPSGENFPELLAHLAKAGIRYSSSFRDDILPYRHQLADGKPGIVEIPVNFAFDDWNFGMSSRTSPRALFGREAILPLWIDEFEATHAWGGVTTLVLHPQVSGRPMRWHILRDFLRHVQAKATSGSRLAPKSPVISSKVIWILESEDRKEMAQWHTRRDVEHLQEKSASSTSNSVVSRLAEMDTRTPFAWCKS
jgi:peptidoglycan/xylan/chitin deacetylase (PgdA/CDA1 family)